MLHVFAVPSGRWIASEEEDKKIKRKVRKVFRLFWSESEMI